MAKKHWSRTALGILIGGVLLSACVLPETNDPFERLPEEQLESIHGELFPFSVSVSTRATHRVERDNKLVGYLTSDLVRLEDFEGQDVELEGVWRNEKMREIFWVESVKVKGATKADVPTESRFSTKNFTFLYPTDWDYTESPDAKLFFIDKADPNRRVFLTFAIEEFSPEAERIEPNIVLGNIAGNKEVITADTGKEKEVIKLFSNDGATQYVFRADYAFEDFDKKRALLDLLESFVEGEEQVALVIEGEKVKAAEVEAAKIAEDAELAALQAKAKLVDDIVDPENTSFLDRLINRDKPSESEVEVAEILEIDDSGEIIGTSVPEEVVADDEVTEVEEAIKEAVTTEGARDYENLIDSRAYVYTSEAFQFTVRTPYTYWYQNFGATNGNLFEMGFADNAIEGRGTVDFWLRGKKVTPPTEPTVVIDGDTLTITKKRNEVSVLEISGPLEFKDAMWSVLESVVAN